MESAVSVALLAPWVLSISRGGARPVFCGAGQPVFCGTGRGGASIPGLYVRLQAKEDRKIRSSLSHSWQDLTSASKVFMFMIIQNYCQTL